MSDASRPRVVGVTVGLALLAGAALRLVDLGGESLWLDELFTVRLATHARVDTLLADLRADVHPPLYFLALRAWVSVVGFSDALVRLPSAITGTLSVGLAAALAWRLYGPRVAGWAAWLVATAPFAVSLDREARGNSALGALALACTVLVLSAQGPDRRRVRIAYALLAGVMVNVHVFGVFVLLFHALWLLAERRSLPEGALLRWGLAMLAGGAALVPWSLVLLEQTQAYVASPWYAMPAGDSLGWLWSALADDNMGVAALLALGCALSLWPDPGAGRRVRGMVLLIAGFAGLVLVPQLVSYALAPVLRARNVMPLVPIIAVVAAAGFAALPARRLGGALLGLLVVLQGLASWRQFADGPRKEQWREAAAQVAAGWSEGDVLIANHPQLWRVYLPDHIAAVGLDAAPPRGAARVWLLQGHRTELLPGEAEWIAAAAPLSDTVLRGARVRSFAPAPEVLPWDQFTLPTPGMVDGDGLHFWWGARVGSSPVEAQGACALELVARGDAAGGVPARIGARLLIGDDAVIDYGFDLDSDWGEHQTPTAQVGAGTQARVEIVFLNDGEVTIDGLTQDRNAHVRWVALRCVGG